MASGEAADCGVVCLSGDGSRELERLDEDAADCSLRLFGSTYRILRRIEGQNANLLLPDSFTLLIVVIVSAAAGRFVHVCMRGVEQQTTEKRDG